MKSQSFELLRYDADEGKVFDWKEPRFHEEIKEDGNIEKIQDHLYAKTIFLGINDNINNYIETIIK